MFVLKRLPMKDRYFSDTLYHTRPTESLICLFGSLAKQYGGLNLAQGIPGFDPPQELLEILSSLIQKDYHQYAPGQGNAHLINQLLAHYRPELPDITDKNLLVVQGATEAGSLIYNYLSQLIEKPFSALAFDPVYETFSHLPAIFGSRFVPFYPEKGRIDFERLEQTIKAQRVRIIFLNSPGNPLGAFLTEEEYDKLLVISEKYHIYLLMDAVYRDLYYQEKPYIPIAHTGKNLFYINSFSKMLSITGWRIGYFITSREHMVKIKQIHDYTGLCAPSLFQQAIATYLEQYHFGKAYLEQLRRDLFESFKTLKGYLLQKGFEIPDIKGGYFIWAKIPPHLPDGYRLALDLYRNQQIAVVPGEHFSERGKRYVRFNIARPSHEIAQAIEKMELFFASH
ncbi:MAG: hypothetical protein CSA95_00805 [Bacteroidetes bacterium]|nr:MAG: hypothetical protein CSA95_00805 [Bacteroidota bacterium]PIE88156.1 MAG: hypothetical protein CSA04_03415 [Bacteroidota bacterium]